MDNMKPSIVEVTNVWADDVFKWMFQSCMDWCGDGGSILFCENYVEVASWFEEYIKSQIEPKGIIYDYRSYYNEANQCVDLTSGQEGFSFMGKEWDGTALGEYKYIPKDDLKFSHSDRIIKAIRQ